MAKSDDPSLTGFVKYLARGKKLQSEVDAEKKAKKDEPSNGLLGQAIKSMKSRKEQIDEAAGMKKGGKVKCMARGGGIEKRGKTRGRMC